MRQTVLDICMSSYQSHPHLFLTMATSLPSGDSQVRRCRDKFEELLLGPGFPTKFRSSVGIDHSRAGLPVPLSHIYVGLGVPSLLIRPSPWCNPFATQTYDATSLDHFKQYCHRRADSRVWLRPLSGKVLWCDCNSSFCHAEILVEISASSFLKLAMTARIAM